MIGRVFEFMRCVYGRLSAIVDSHPVTADCTVVYSAGSRVLADLDLVRVFQRVAICVKDAHVLVRIAVELFADLREIVATLHFVRLTATLATACGCAHCAACVDTEVGGDVVCIRIDEFDLIPELVLSFFRRRNSP